MRMNFLEVSKNHGLDILIFIKDILLKNDQFFL